jgi:hypothetical protein
VRDISLNGARIRLDEPFSGQSGEKLRFIFNSIPPLRIQSTVIWHRPYADGTDLAVEFDGVTKNVARHLENLTTWHLEQKEGYQLITIQQSINEHSSFSELLPRLGPSLVFDFRHLASFNSVGVNHWLLFLRQIPDAVEYAFCGCSVTFCTQACFVADLLGRGKVLSFFAPYECMACSYEGERELQTKLIEQQGGRVIPPEFECPMCNSTLHFADLPERCFQFIISREKK